MAPWLFFILLPATILLSIIQCRFLIRFSGSTFALKKYIIFSMLPLIEITLTLKESSTAWMNQIPWQLHQPISSLIGIAIVLLFTRFILQKSWMISAISAPPVVLVNVLIQHLSNSFVLLMPYAKSFGFLFFFQTYLMLLPAYLLLRYFERYRLQPLPKEKNKYLLLALTPLLFIIILMQTTFNSAVVYSSDGLFSMSSSANGPLFDALQGIFLSALAFLCAYGCFFSYQKIMAYFAEEKEILLLQQQLAIQQVQANESKLRYDLTRSFRHDLKNHILVLKRLLECAQIEPAINYIDSIERVSTQLSREAQTGNAALDALCGEKLELARRNGIEVKFDVALPTNIGINDFDLCTIFANALDNAIKACVRLRAEPKCIDVKATCRRHFLIIDMINPCEKSEIRQGGLGLPNIRKIVDQYNGTLEIRQSPPTFVLTILLPCKVEPAD